VAGVGVDVVAISRLATLFDRTPALATRLLAPSERGLSIASRAARVAAKEAVGKALGAPGDFSWQDVTVARTRADRPYLVLSGATLAAADAQGITHLHLSISHDADVATAIVIAERAAGPVVRPALATAMPATAMPAPAMPADAAQTRSRTHSTKDASPTKDTHSTKET
jgi:holo-[acyl-carrier protein] synthase